MINLKNGKPRLYKTYFAQAVNLMVNNEMSYVDHRVIA